MEIIQANSRGSFRNDWLDSRHSFSFADYYDPQRMGFSSLRVINEDWINANGGFPMHGHRDMEIVTYVMQGALSHKDSLGNGSTMRVGDVQRMSAGRGILHSEFNHSADETVHLLQIWLLPTATGIKPSYAQAYFPPAARQGQWQLLVSADGREGSLTMNTDANLYTSILTDHASVSYHVPAGRATYLHLARGTLHVSSSTGQQQALQAGDALALRENVTLTLSSADSGEFLLFDLP